MYEGASDRFPLVGIAEGSLAGPEGGKTLVVDLYLLDGDLEQVAALGTATYTGPPIGLPLGGSNFRVGRSLRCGATSGERISPEPASSVSMMKLSPCSTLSIGSCLQSNSYTIALSRVMRCKCSSFATRWIGGAPI